MVSPEFRVPGIPEFRKYGVHRIRRKTLTFRLTKGLGGSKSIAERIVGRRRGWKD